MTKLILNIIDFCEGVDIVSNDGLITKLALYGSTKTPIKRIKNWQADRAHKVVVNGESSSLKGSVSSGAI